MLEPEPVHRLRTTATLDLRAHLVANGGGNADEAIGGLRDPVEPAVEYLDQAVIAELRMGQRDQVVDHGNDADTLRFQTICNRVEIGVPGRIEQQQLVAWPDFQQRRPLGDTMMASYQPG
ncbi:hypothetical protein D3C72_2057480 [compost metagenome]